jgi:hypothetical protein
MIIVVHGTIMGGGLSTQIQRISDICLENVCFITFSRARLLKAEE